MLSLTINGVEYIQNLRRQTLRISESLQSRGFTLEASIFVHQQEIAAPVSGQFLIFYNAAGGREYAGRIATVEQTQAANPDTYDYKLTCVDSTSDFDSQLINAEFPAQLAGDIIRVLVGRVGRGFTSNNVADGIAINTLRTEFEAPSSVIQKIADSIGHTWFVDYYRDINFFHTLDRPAPIVEINVDSDLSTYFDLDLQEAWEQVKNRIYLTGGKAKSTNPDVVPFTGDGSQKFIPLGYEPFDFDSVEVTVDGQPMNIKKDTIDGVSGDGQGAIDEVYVCVDNWGVRFPDNYAPSDGADVNISYSYAYDPLVVVEDPDSIAEMRARENTPEAPSDGVHELRFDVPDLRVDSEDAIVQYGQLLLLRYAKIPYTVSFGTHVQGWHVGQNLRVFSSSGRRSFDRQFYVTGVSKALRVVHGEPQLEYQITASSNPLPG